MFLPTCPSLVFSCFSRRHSSREKTCLVFRGDLEVFFKSDWKGLEGFFSRYYQQKKIFGGSLALSLLMKMRGRGKLKKETKESPKRELSKMPKVLLQQKVKKIRRTWLQRWKWKYELSVSEQKRMNSLKLISKKYFFG